jgi:DNA-binding NarL/FixJ family response regulator
MSITVFLADDHTVVREGLHSYLSANSDIEVIGEAGDGLEATRAVAKLCPDVAVLDLAMPVLDGIEATERISGANGTTRVVILSMHAMLDYVMRGLQAGADAYVLKAAAGSELTRAVRAVHAGHRYLSPRVTDQVVDKLLACGPFPESNGPLSELNQREREILKLVADGQSNKEIAATLSLSHSTINTYRSRMMRKLGVDDLVSLVKLALKHGLTSLD